MTRVRIGFFLLLLLLILGIAVQLRMEQLHRPVAQMLTLAAEDAMTDNWQEARPLSESAHRMWQKQWRFSATLADHAPMEEIDGLFARLTVAAWEQDRLEYAATCRELARRITAMSDAHTLNWWNLM